MKVEDQIDAYMSSLPPARQADLRALHGMMLKALPGAQLWYLDGKNEQGKVVSNPNIGYGRQTMKYADGKTREFYRIGLSANTSGISVFVMGLDDKKFLAETYGARIGKAQVTGYCIKFKKLADIDANVLMEIVAVRESA